MQRQASLNVHNTKSGGEKCRSIVKLVYSKDEKGKKNVVMRRV